MTDYSNEIKSNLERAETNLNAAKDLLDKEYYDIAASRAYYAAFYSASALLLNENMDTSKPSGVIALIHQHLSKRENWTRNKARISTGCSNFAVLEIMEFLSMLLLERQIVL